LLVAMMNYGAAAQIQLNYKKDNLMNSWLPTSEQNVFEGYNIDALKEDSAGKFKYETTPVTTFCTRIANQAILKGAIELNVGVLNLKSAYKGNVSLVYWSEADYNAATTLTTENATAIVPMELSSGAYQAKLPGAPARLLGNTSFYCIMIEKDGETYYSPLQTYSIHTYASNKINDANSAEALKNICKSILLYSNAAEAYLGK